MAQGVKITKTKGLGIAALKEVNGRQGRGLAERAKAQAHAKAATAVRAAWANTLEQVNLVLAQGVGNARGAGSVQIENSEGTKIKVPLGGYAPLTDRYRKKDPRSTRFWRKHGGIPKDGRSTNLANAVAKALRGKSRVRDDSLPLRLEGGNWQFRSTFRPNRLPGALDKIILHNFVSVDGIVPFKWRRDGEKLVSEGDGRWKDRSTFKVVQFPETHRPLLTKVAHRLGVSIRLSLQKSLATRSRKS